MVKTLNINGIECRFKSSAAIPRMYRIKFHRDIFSDMSKLQTSISGSEEEGNLSIESLEMFENIAYLMHKHGDPEQPETIEEWLDQFDTFSIYEVLPEIVSMWGLENKQTSKPKKKAGR